VPHEPIYLSEEQIARIDELRANIQTLVDTGLPLDQIDDGIVTIEDKIAEIEATAPAGTPKRACTTCNPVTHCPDCSNPIGPDGLTTLEGGAYHADEEPSDD